MIFNKHSAYEGQHAFLGASKYHWLNYDEEKLISSYENFNAAQRGSAVGERLGDEELFVHEAVAGRIHLPTIWNT